MIGILDSVNQLIGTKYEPILYELLSPRNQFICIAAYSQSGIPKVFDGNHIESKQIET
jgi:hypothetical protein